MVANAQHSVLPPWLASVLAVGLLACHAEPNGPSTSNTPLTPVQEALVQRYQDEFRETIPRPAIFTPTLGANSTCNWHVTSNAWLKPSGKTSTLLTLYTSPDGRAVEKKESATYLRPAGTFRVLVALVRHANIGSDGLALWEAAQRQMNTDHQSFATSKGYATPVVTFTNTNVVFE